MKRIVSLLLALILLAGMPVTAAPAALAPAASEAAETSPTAVEYETVIEVEDFAVHGLTYEKADGVVTFVLSYESGIERTVSVFNPPSGSVFKELYTLPQATGSTEFTFKVEESALATAGRVTLKFFGNDEEAMDGLIWLFFSVDDAMADKSLAVDTRQVIGTAILSESGHCMLPVRVLFESQGMDVSWDGDTKTVIISYGGQTVGSLTVGSSILYDEMDGEIDLGEPCINVDGHVYFCGDSFLGNGIDVDAETLEIYVEVLPSSTSVVPTPESFTTNQTENGSGFARHPAANDITQIKPINLSARSSYPRWVWTDTGVADIRWLDTKTYLSEDDQSILAKCAPNITFNSDTVFPDNMPEDYDPAAILGAGKDPGLGVRALHEQGITGEGIGIAIIDQVLYTDHPEYADKLALYEEIHITPDEETAMHGSAVASIAVGENVGVAPGAKLYYWGVNLSRSVSEKGDNSDVNIAFGEGLAIAVDRVIEVNSALPDNEKIRVISISRGFSNLEDEGVQAFLAAVERAQEAGIFVITTSTNLYYDWLDEKNDLAGLGKLDLAGDANDLSNYTLGMWQQLYPAYYASKLLVPMDARTTADYTVGDGYVFYADGGWSWAVPYLAGVYALACQVDPEVTPEQFWMLALVTASSTTVQIRSPQDVAYGADGSEYTLEHIINPTAIMAALKN